MATAGAVGERARNDARFFVISSCLMVLVLVAGFSAQLAAGRSSFAAPWPVHLHAILFFGWTAFFLTQVGLATTGSIATHRRLGWIALVLIPLLVVVGIATTVRVVRLGTVPFFFTPGYFMVMDPMTVLTFAGLAGVAIRLRRQTEWHRRLMICAMAVLLAPGFGRLIPMPLIVPFSGLVASSAPLVFPIAGMIADYRRDGRVHRAWFRGMAVMLLSLVAIETLGRSPVAAALVHAVTSGAPGSNLPALGYPPAPAT